jgi:hypothetical protein
VSQVAAAREGGGGTVHENSDDNNDDATAAATTATTTKPNLNKFLKQRRMGKEVIGSAFLALTLSLSPSFSNAAITYDDPLHHPSTPTTTASSTILLSRGTLLPPDEVVIAELTLQTKEIEREAAKDKKRADVEKSIAAFFDYDARMAEEQEARIEAAEFRAEAEASYDKEQAELLKIEERKAEKEFRAAQTPQEKRSSAMKARVRHVIHHVLYSHWGNICIVLFIFLTLNLNQSFCLSPIYLLYHTIYNQELLRKEKEIERRERRAERDEQIYLAEERQEQIILKQKEEAKEKEEKKFIAVEKEYENVAELAKEEEVELRYDIVYSTWLYFSIYTY